MKHFFSLFALVLLLAPVSVFAEEGGENPANNIITNAIAEQLGIGNPTFDKPSAGDTTSKETDARADTVGVPSPLDPVTFLGSGTASADICSKGFKDDRVGFILCRAARLINVFLAGLAALSILPIVIGGVYLIISQGSSDRVEKGKKSLFWGVIGLALAFAAIVIFQVFLQALLPGATG